MKRKHWLIPICVLAGILLLVASQAFAVPEEPVHDSFYLTQEQREIPYQYERYPAKETHFMCQTFQIPFLYAFMGDFTIDDIISDFCRTTYIYAEYTGLDDKYWHVVFRQNGDALDFRTLYINLEDLTSDRIPKLIGDDVTVYGVYIFEDQMNTNYEFHPIIAYKTSKGEFFCYRDNAYIEYLFPKEVFQEFRKEKTFDRYDFSGNFFEYPGHQEGYAVWEPWRIDSPEFNLNAPCPRSQDWWGDYPLSTE